MPSTTREPDAAKPVTPAVDAFSAINSNVTATQTAATPAIVAAASAATSPIVTRLFAMPESLAQSGAPAYALAENHGHTMSRSCCVPARQQTGEIESLPSS